MKILTIDRAKWRRGSSLYKSPEYGGTALCNVKGFMCCLGFDAVACGFEPNYLTDVADPEELVDNLPTQDLNRFNDYIVKRMTKDEDESEDGWHHTSPIKATITANDDSLILDSDREKKIREYLMQVGWDDVVFVGEFPEFAKENLPEVVHR